MESIDKYYRVYASVNLDNIYANMKELKDIVLKKKHRLIEEDSRLNTYYEIGRLIVEAQGEERRAKYGNGLIKEWSQ